jgi:hypothetical protein
VPAPIRSVASLQGAYYLCTGLWPVLSRRSFEAVSGRKQDYWLVQTVGLLTTSLAAGLLHGIRGGREHSPDMQTAALAAAFSFGAVDLVHGLRGRISFVYVLDALVQAELVRRWRRAAAG